MASTGTFGSVTARPTKTGCAGGHGVERGAPGTGVLLPVLLSKPLGPVI
jgi:hypothetical protein